MVAGVAEIAELLDQCTPKELANILRALEGEEMEDSLEGEPEAEGPGTPQAAAGAGTPDSEGAAAAARVPVPPPAPRPMSGNRRPSGGRPGTAGGSRPGTAGNGRSGAGGGKWTASGRGSGALAPRGTEGAGAAVSLDVLKRLLAEHSAELLSEVRRLVQVTPAAAAHAAVAAGPPSAVEGFDLEVLTQAFKERDAEVKTLEARLAELQSQLAVKDQRVAELGGELDKTLREVRHRQLDLEFQQLKLEERVRSNGELEQAQRCLSARVEEASLTAKHAALDMEMRLNTPRSIRAQGSLPWTLRKNKLLDISY